MRHRVFKWLTFTTLVLSLAACGSAPDEEVPDLTMDETISRTNAGTLPISGTVEPGATLQVATTAQPVPRIVETGELDEDGQLIWNDEIDLKEEDGANRISVSAFDRVGNTRIIHRTVVKDTTAPEPINWFLGAIDDENPEVIVLWIEFDEAVGVKIDTFVKVDEIPEQPWFAVRDEEGISLSGVLKPFAEDEEGHSIWFSWEPEEPLTPGEYELFFPAGISDDFGNATEDITETLTVPDPDATDPELP